MLGGEISKSQSASIQMLVAVVESRVVLDRGKGQVISRLEKGLAALVQIGLVEGVSGTGEQQLQSLTLTLSK